MQRATEDCESSIDVGKFAEERRLFEQQRSDSVRKSSIVGTVGVRIEIGDDGKTILQRRVRKDSHGTQRYIKGRFD